MKIFKRAIAATELLLIFPAALFMTALFLRNVQPEQYQPAHTAQLIVNWFTKGPVWLVLWVLLMALPLAVLIIGAATLLRSWKNDAQLRQAARQMFGIVRAGADRCRNPDGGRDPGDCGAARDYRLMAGDELSTPRPVLVVG